MIHCASVCEHHKLGLWIPAVYIVSFLYFRLQHQSEFTKIQSVQQTFIPKRISKRGVLKFYQVRIYWIFKEFYEHLTGKSLSEALLFAEHGENMLCTKIVLNVRNNFCTQHVLPRFEFWIFMYWTCNSMNNLSSYCGLVDAKIRASDKDLPVTYWRYKCHN